MLKSLVPLALIWIAAVAIAAGAVGPNGPAPHGRHFRPVPQQPAAGPVLSTRPSAQAPGPVRSGGPGDVGAAAPDAAVLKQYCLTCHNERVKAGGLLLDAMDVTQVGSHPEAWEKVVRKLKTGMMPPSGAPRPDRSVLDRLAAQLETRLDGAAVVAESLEAPALRRLNRTEYANAVRDLLAMDVNVTALLPADPSSEGFDNIAEALAVSPTLIQAYVSTAMKISRLAVGDRTMLQSTATYTAPPNLAQDRHIDGLPLGTRGGLIITHTFPLDAEYEFTLGGMGPGGGGAAANLDVTLDGERMSVENPRKFRLPVTAGPHTLGVALVDRQRGAGVDDIYSDFRTNATFTVGGGVQSVAIAGPLNPTGVGDTPSRRRIFVCYPGRLTATPTTDAAVPTAAAAAAPTDTVAASPAEEEACARQILTTIARRAYRGPVTERELTTLMEFYQQGRRDGDFESGIQQALARVLVAPRFVYRAEQEPEQVAAGVPYRLSDVDLASRLSFFLWSSIPDDELLDLAINSRLSDPQVLRQQVRRMLADAKSEALIENFAGQWLYLRELDHVQTDAKNFDDNLRTSFRRETEMLFEAIVREDRSLIDLIDADYTFVDERLARHYGIPTVRGSHFRRVMLAPDHPRRGVLGHGSVLTVTSSATRTSPVIRGKWILENLLGAPPPEPPPGVETNLDGDEDTLKATTVRQRLELHRGNPVCASCHNIIDPVGFALENFDLVGTWRDTEGSAPIDSKGRLADGTAVNGPADLRHALLSRSEAFMTVATEKLLIYALGRPLRAADMPTVRGIVRRAAANNNRFSALLTGVVESDAFQKRIKGH